MEEYYYKDINILRRWFVFIVVFIACIELDPIISGIIAYLVGHALFPEKNIKVKRTIQDDQQRDNTEYQSDYSQESQKDKTESSFTEKEIHDLYRELAKKYHPDFAQNETDKKFRNDLLKKINLAYEKRDFKTLQNYKLD